MTLQDRKITEGLVKEFTAQLEDAIDTVSEITGLAKKQPAEAEEQLQIWWQTFSTGVKNSVRSEELLQLNKLVTRKLPDYPRAKTTEEFVRVAVNGPDRTRIEGWKQKCERKFESVDRMLKRWLKLVQSNPELILAPRSPLSALEKIILRVKLLWCFKPIRFVICFSLCICVIQFVWAQEVPVKWLQENSLKLSSVFFVVMVALAIFDSAHRRDWIWSGVIAGILTFIAPFLSNIETTTKPAFTVPQINSGSVIKK